MLLLAVAATFLGSWSLVTGHGRLMDPPARNSMWRLGFPNPVNYNDNELYCGGRVTQWARNKGKCGVCGDPHHLTTKDHEVGGKFANGIITREYIQGDVIDATVHITANHKGYFEFRICPVKDPQVEVTQECLDKHLLKMANGEGTRYELPEEKANQFFNVSLRLPADITCSRCVIQWKYRTGNTWDKDEGGKHCVGCGPQEEFYNCADVTIHQNNGQEKQQIKKHLKVLTTLDSDEKNIGSNVAKLPMKDISEAIRSVSELPFPGKISEYGKRKLDFITKMENGQFSSWNNSENLVKAMNKMSPFAHLALKNGAGQEEVGLKYEDLKLQPYRVSKDMRSVNGPAGVAYRWKAGSLNSEDIDKIRRRFGLSGSAEKDNAVVDGWKKFGGDTDKYLQLKGNKSQNLIIGNKTPTKKIIENEVKQQKLFPHLKISKNINSSGNSLLKLSTQHMRRLNANSELFGDSTVKANAAKQLHETLRKMILNAKENSQQQDTFLRRWKLLRLRHIAAQKALNAVDTPKENPVKHLKNGRSAHSKPYSMIDIASLQNASNIRTMSIFTPPPSASSKMYYPKVQDNTPLVSTPSTDAAQAKDRKQKKVLKQKLPSWLVKVLKMNNKKAVNSKGNIQNQSLNKNSSQATHTNFKQENGEVRQATGIGYRAESSGNLLTQERNSNNTAQRSERILRKYIKGHNKARGNRTNEKAQLSSEDKNLESFKIIKKHLDNVLNDDNKDDDINDTESLIKFIVSRLLSRKKIEDLAKYISLHDGKNQPLSRDTLARRKTGLNAENKGTDFVSYSWLVPGTTQAPHIEIMPLENDGSTGYPRKGSKPQHRTAIEIGDILQVSDNPHHSKTPSIRADARPYSGVVLGANFNNNKRFIKFAKQNNTGIKIAKLNKRNDLQRNSQKNQPLQLNKNSYISQGQSPNLLDNKLNYYALFQEQKPQKRWLKVPAFQLSDKSNKQREMSSIGESVNEVRPRGQQDTSKTELVCESLIKLGGGMDRWCTDNCNANFCPQSICVCTNKIRYVAYSEVLKSPVAYSGVFPSQRNEEAKNEILKKEIYNPIVLHTFTDNSLTKDSSQIENTRFPKYIAPKDESSQAKIASSPLFIQSPTGEHILLSKNDGPIISNMTLPSENLIGPSNTLIQEPTKINQSSSTNNINMGGAKSIRQYPLEKSTNQHGHHMKNILASSSGHSGISNLVKRYHRKLPSDGLKVAENNLSLNRFSQNRELALS